MLVNVIAILIASILALAGQLIAGRLVGLAMTALCSAAMAYFLMPPAFSLRVAETSDLIALVFHGAIGLVIAKSAPSGKNRMTLREEPIRTITPPKQPETDIRAAMAELMSGSLVAIEVGSLALPGQGDVLRILIDVVTTALRDPEIRRISVYGGKRPGVQRLFVVAHRVWPPPLYDVITVGKRDEDCEPAVFPGWPAQAAACWFDNGYDVVYQVSIKDG